MFKLAIVVTDVSIVVFALLDTVHEIAHAVDAVGRVFQAQFHEARRTFPAEFYVGGEEIEPVEEWGDDSVAADGGLIGYLCVSDQHTWENREIEKGKVLNGIGCDVSTEHQKQK